MERRRVPLDRRIPSILCIVIMTVWTISFLATLILPNYDPPVTVHALMMAVAGATLAAWQRKPTNGNGRSRGYDDRPRRPYPYDREEGDSY